MDTTDLSSVDRLGYFKGFFAKIAQLCGDFLGYFENNFGENLIWIILGNFWIRFGDFLIHHLVSLDLRLNVNVNTSKFIYYVARIVSCI